jgi:hypothetical protein
MEPRVADESIISREPTMADSTRVWLGARVGALVAR